MRNLEMPIIWALILILLTNFGCTSLPFIESQDVIWRDISRKDLGLLDCGITGGLPSRLNACAIRNPAYAQHHSPSGHRWHLVMVDNQLRLEFWVHHQSGSVWSNIMPYRPDICSPLGKIQNGDRRMVFELATTADYQIAFRHPLPVTMRSERARFFVLGDSEISGVAADERDNRFRNVDREELLWARCVAKFR